MAEHSSLGVNTIRRAEATDHATSLTNANDLAIRRAFESAGIEFIDGTAVARACGYENGTKRRASILCWK